MSSQNCAPMDLLKKHRPRRLADKFEGLNAEVNRYLARAIATNKLPRLIAFTGPAGTGKGTSARILGRRHVCQNKDRHPYDPCLECPACRSLDGLAGAILYSDDGYTEFDATSLSGEVILKYMERDSAYNTLSGNEHLFVIDELTRNHTGVQERLLRFVENTRSLVIITTIDRNSILEPLLNRFTHLVLRPPTRPQIVAGLIRIARDEGFILQPDAAELVCRNRANNPRECVDVLGTAIGAADGEIIDSVVVKTTLEIRGLTDPDCD